jgi:hypothetical protein
MGLLVLLITSCIGVISAAPTGFHTCGAIYIGETVDVTKCVSGEYVGWWASTADRYTTIPSFGIQIVDKQSFYADPRLSGYTGNWYNLESDFSSDPTSVAFTILEPQSCGTIYIGDIVDVSKCVTGENVGWWASAADIYTTLPSKTVGITNEQSFDVAPNNFLGSSGAWYNLDVDYKPTSVAFQVMEPKNFCGFVSIGDTIDVSKCVSGKSIGWWPSAADRMSTLPAVQMGITDKRSFSVSSGFTGYDGSWYNINPKTGYAGTLAFFVL